MKNIKIIFHPSKNYLRRFPEAGTNHSCHYECISVDVFNNFLQEEEAAAETPENALETLVVGSSFLNFVVEIFNNESEELNHSKNEGSASNSAKMISR